MTTFKRRSVHAAVVAGLAAGVTAGAAQAVHVSPTGRGSVLVYPYYTVRAEGGTGTAYYDSYVSVVNTSGTTKAVRVKVMEGKRGAEVLSFNLFLSPRDVWTAAVVRTVDGAGLLSADRSCVVPNALFASLGIPTAGSLNHFKNSVYASAPADGGGTTLDRTREGHIEIIEMGEVTNATAAAAAKHGLAGVPANCAYFEASDATLSTALAAPSGGLMGSVSLINVTAGTEYAYNAVALENWQTGTPNYSPTGTVLPRLTSGNVTTSTVFTAQGNVVTSTWVSSRDAVSAALMSESLANEWLLQSATSSGTDWIVTFPTKYAYASVGVGAAVAPFASNFSNGQSCDPISLSAWTREEAAPFTAASGFLCYQTNVLTFAGSNILGSVNAVNVSLSSATAGWASIDFNQPFQSLTPVASTVNGMAALSQTHRGLPALGYAVQDFNNGMVNGVLSTYGALHKHRSQISVGTTP